MRDSPYGGETDDDQIQEFIFHLYDLPSSAVGFNIDTDDSKSSHGASIESSKAVKDAQQLIIALRQTTRLIITSSVYRTLLADLLSVLSSVLAEAAQDVKIAAMKVQTTAEVFEAAARKDELTGDDVDIAIMDAREVRDDLKKANENIHTKGAVKAKWVFVGRLQQVRLFRCVE